MFEFLFSEYFTDLTQEDFDLAYETILAMFSGITTLYENSSNKEQKRNLLINLLVAWYLANIHPSKVINISSDGGKAVLYKSARDVKIRYIDFKMQQGLEQLTSNIFGINALMLLQGCPERYKIYGKG